MSIDGLPLHPLVVHAAVVLAPVAALLALLYAVVRAWRRILRHVTAGLALVGAVAVEVAYLSGKAFVEDVPALGQAVTEHSEFGRQLVWAVWILAILAVASWWVLPVTSVRGVGGGAAARFLRPALLVLQPLAAVVVLWLAFRAGHSGATAVWGGLLP
ncbi:DUF2231 domain-containing protein [Nocardioides sp.]|uniref:DUF2231 domain-containing protein n=1 Tax=Nocardioides sp. TaxID=35761 RepID=UPI002B937FBC|nr:DUF2231 domain-containing protein [Nocardioides sp.]HSX66115.1 DUF2231 domain-containing protein [Nocardioides sp.]